VIYDAFSEQPCSKTMENGGVVKKDDLNVQPGKEGTTVASKKPTKEEPQWETLTVQTTDAKQVSYTPISKDGTTGTTKTVDVADNKKPTEIVFDEILTASSIRVTPIGATDDSKPTLEVVSAVVCAEAQGTLKLSIYLCSSLMDMSI
jgi:D-alanyl-D-alanine carboxypeptidase